MLTLQERQRVLAFFRYCSLLCQLPVQVNYQSQEVRSGTDTKWKRWICWGSYGLFVTHAVYKASSLFYTVLFSSGGTPLHQIMLHFNLVSAAATFVYWYYLLYIKYADVNAGFVETTLSGSFTSAGGMDSGRMTSGDSTAGALRLWERSLEDLIAILLPYMAPLLVTMIGACVIYDPTMKMLLYSALPDTYQNRLTFWLCYVEEIRFLGMMIGVAVPAWQCQVIAFDLINHDVEAILGDLRKKKSNWKPAIEGYCRDLRSLQVYVTVLNAVHRNLIFTMKINCLGMSITSGYAAIAHFSDHPIFGTMYYIMFLEAFFMYSFSYQRAFRVPGLITKAKSLTKLRAQRLVNKPGRDGIGRQVRSTPAVGIKVGDFHMLERKSTPVFLHYVLTNIVNLLVTFK